MKEGKPAEWRAREATRLRDEAKATARDAMSPADRAELEAWRKETGHRDLTFDELKAKAESRGFTGDEVYEEIIRSASQRSNPIINRRVLGED